MQKDKFILFVNCNFLVLLSELSTTVCSQNINKKIVNIADENLTDYSFLSRYHYTKSKNYLKDDIEFVTEFPCLLGHPELSHVYWDNLYFPIFIGTPCTFPCLLVHSVLCLSYLKLAAGGEGQIRSTSLV